MSIEIVTLRPEGLIRISVRGLSCYLLLRRNVAALVDTGGPGHLELIRQALTLNGLGFDALQMILLTHGSVLSAFNVAALRDGKSLPVHINRLDAPRLDLEHPPGPRHRKRAAIERVRARWHNYRPPEADVFVGDGDWLDVWFGLKVVHLPGPTPGHCGYYCRHLNVLFSGALPASPGDSTLIDRLTITDPAAYRDSIRKIEELKPALICGQRTGDK